MRKLFIILLLALVQVVCAQQINGVVIDENTGERIPFASAQYKKSKVAVSGNAQGEFSISRLDGKYLTFSAVGYKSLRILIGSNTPLNMRIPLKPDTKTLDEVKVKSKRKRYRRKDNPAVALMRRVIAAKKKNDLRNHDYYSFNKYQKITLAVNDIQPAELESDFFKKREWLTKQVETCPYNNKLILPLSVDETVTQNIYRKNPETEKTIVKGTKSTGINNLLTTGETLSTMAKDVFTDVDLYDDQIRILQAPFTSPIGKDAIGFYKFYIIDTVAVAKDSCYHLQFLPNNLQDFGFRGEIWIIADSTLHVKKCELTLPKQSNVNFVDNLHIKQEYNRLPNGEWALTTDDMLVELELVDFLTKGVAIRTTRRDEYSFKELPDKMFKGKAKEKYDTDYQMKDEDFWQEHRGVELTKSESSIDSFLNSMRKTKGFNIVMFGVRALFENFIETGKEGKDSKVDIGPVNTFITKNFIDGVRTRFSAQTTANLNKNWFASGYIARGWDSKKNYYKGEVTYSFNKKKYLPREFPKRTITFTSTYDVMSPSDKFLRTDKDNVFTSFKWTEVDKMMFYNRQKLSFEYETDWDLKFGASIKTEKNEACGELYFRPVWLSDTDAASYGHGALRTTEATFEVRYSPGEEYINTKQRRVAINHDAPVYTISHTVGLKGFLGGEYKYNFTEASIYKRIWLNSWGRLDMLIKGGIQWDKVPFPLLIMPPANLSYIAQDEMFSLINNMEFLNDRYASIDLSWDLNGKIFNRIPLFKKLQWREYIGFKCLWGTLSDKNNPTLTENGNDGILMRFPDGTYIMDKNKPYAEFAVGIQNIFKILHVQYVRRLGYEDLPTAKKHGVRFKLVFTF